MTHAEVFVMRRGLWEDDKNIVQLTKASLQNHRSMNPCPVYERESKTLFLFFTCVPIGNQARLCYITSQDTGATWSQTEDLTERVIVEKEKNWATFAVGPGRGVQMKGGRLIIPAYAYFKSTNYCTTMLEVHLATESKLKQQHGQAFDKPSTIQKLIETGKGCQGSVLKIHYPDQGTSDQKERKNLVIYMNNSPLDPNLWKMFPKTNDGPSGYSDLAECKKVSTLIHCLSCYRKSFVLEKAYVRNITWICHHPASVIIMCSLCFCLIITLSASSVEMVLCYYIKFYDDYYMATHHKFIYMGMKFRFEFKYHTAESSD
uniref:exo-alpha-sialidase n=1 Tax=Sinocyclocheilus rhinocerous TaxID=307959 RepID=A0A673N8C9_9TELE